jgi:hypothetical protein
MANETMFEIATRTKMRFQFKGPKSVEEIWDLPVEDLDSIFKSLNTQLKQVKEESLLNTKSKADQALDIQVEIVKYIVQVKLAEQAAKLQAKEIAAKKQLLYQALANRENKDMEGKSAEEIRAMIEALG